MISSGNPSYTYTNDFYSDHRFSPTAAPTTQHRSCYSSSRNCQTEISGTATAAFFICLFLTAACLSIGRPERDETEVDSALPEPDDSAQSRAIASQDEQVARRLQRSIDQEEIDAYLRELEVNHETQRIKKLEVRRNFIRLNLPVETYKREVSKGDSTSQRSFLSAVMAALSFSDTCSKEVTEGGGGSGEFRGECIEMQLAQHAVDVSAAQNVFHASAPYRPASVRDLDDTSSRNEGSEGRPVCSICLMSFQNGDAVCRSNNEACIHAFHKDCMKDWLLQHEECPCCREIYLLDAA